MADVHASMGVILRDFQGVQSSHELLVKIADTTTLAQIVTDVAAYCAVLNPLTGGEGVNVWVRLNIPSTGLKTGPVANMEMGNGALFSFGKTGMGGKVSIMVPAWDTTCDTSGKPDPTKSEVSDWISWIQANGTHLAVETREHVIPTGFLGVRSNGRNHRKALTKNTFTPGS